MDRRSFLQLGGAVGASALFAPKLAFAQAATDRRFLFIIQRGAADGLSIVAPTGDPAFAATRGELAQPLASGIKLDSTFTLHPALVETGRMFAARQAAFVTAVASPYRDRSHFDGQNVLETGGSLPYRLSDGWMNRLVKTMAADPRAIAFSPTVPAALRGSARVSSFAPSGLPAPAQDLMMRVGELYAADHQLGPLWNAALEARHEAGSLTDVKGAGAAGMLAAKMMAGPGGSRIGMIETDGWDTHSAQNARLNNQLKNLDALLAAYRDGLGADWGSTLVIVATEFGRTARINGTNGTDHGTGSAALLMGGALAGGRVYGDWPGLAPAALYENRDVRPTTDLDALIATVLAQHYRQDGTRLGATLFPETSPKPLTARMIA
ncbi:DUF1501 domain-containing protein [Sphingomonas ginkgonis]|uniref:DUF1501 domain-containing protein n=1 Tax=Sphingomonas ginkgonis TaxID=2315330 RepID=A0A3R9WU19_9SPHN|nr:DUF1501 domain-containing protein [Sphingomonas ginkgonis]RST31814.1 DUF1501 domain-containing protein [Sphingomonas ginkgonis]